MFCHHGMLSEHRYIQKSQPAASNWIMTRKNELTHNIRPWLGKQKTLDIPSKICFIERYHMILRSFKLFLDIMQQKLVNGSIENSSKMCQGGRGIKNEHRKQNQKILYFIFISYLPCGRISSPWERLLLIPRVANTVSCSINHIYAFSCCQQHLSRVCQFSSVHLPDSSAAISTKDGDKQMSHILFWPLCPPSATRTAHLGRSDYVEFLFLSSHCLSCQVLRAIMR